MCGKIILHWFWFLSVPFRYSHVRTNQSARKNFKLASVLMSVVIVFLLCNIPRLICNAMEYSYLDALTNCGDNFDTPVWFRCLVRLIINNLLCHNNLSYIYFQLNACSSCIECFFKFCPLHALCHRLQELFFWESKRLHKVF